MKKMKTASPGQVIFKLNPIIRGWAEYYKYANSSKTFRDLNSKLWSLFFSWLTHKYPRSSRTSLYKNHFLSSGRSHIPKGYLNENGKSTLIKLISFQDCRIVKYTQVRESVSLREKIDNMKIRSKRTTHKRSTNIIGGNTR